MPLTTIQRSALVLYSAREMFDLVNDVAAYPAFMEGCVGAQVLERGEDFMVARLDLRKKGVSYSFTTRNTLKPPGEIAMVLHSGPFRELRGTWLFKPLSDSACKVSLHLEFEVNNGLLGVAATSLFAGVANNLVAALTERAAALYGKKP
ncbi:MAG TPA: type II toxin-antitoxin system RatA family toxin [Porticoccaceae bacterium]|nr:type II toxin-antitoxin system RatA family toxin [Porticoccaceae bacterium]